MVFMERQWVWRAVAALMVVIAGCAQDDGPPRILQAGEASRPGKHLALEPPCPPDYHRPLEWWRLNHMTLTAGPSRADGLLGQGECLVCHDPARTCNRCHQFVGAPEVDQ